MSHHQKLMMMALDTKGLIGASHVFNVIFIFFSQIELKIRKSQSGLGAGGVMSVADVSATRSKSHKNWEKARERFADTCQPDPATTKPHKSNAWVKSEEPEDSQTSLETGSQS